ncbi:Receptor-like protein kinase FERONIA [Morella rubra]|uniref:Receptor-like protein kinase FERONIA n=1 Tax=Morella rubra TaxID=262757 RepID=A0A6A1VI11_9ROSI|nr:Receptor-like protein kinase FERONIA [Morella rubra]
MNTIALYLSFLHLLGIHAAAESLPPYTATDYFLLDCGSSSDSTSIDGRHWEGDSHSKFSPPDIQTTTIASTASVQNSIVTQVPYMTARIFHEKFSYSFPVSGGLKFLRLYFYPATYSGIHKSKYLYTVTANNFTLLSNFSAFHRAESFNKEFVIPELHSQCLYITFIPSPRSYAFINETEADVIRCSGGNGIPVYKEYVVLVPDRSRGKQEYLWLALHPRIEANSKYLDAILNGVEIFKLNRSDGSLAGLYQEAVVVSTGLEPNNKLTERKNSLMLVFIITGGLLGGVIAISMICFFVLRRSKRVKASGSGTSDPRSKWISFPKTKSTQMQGSSLPSNLCRHVSFAEIKAATKNFDDVLIIGVGGFGNVYKGYIDGATTAVAIKRLKSGSQQGAQEFMTEIVMLSQLRHRNLVSLIGYCNDGSEMILVYEYMAHGTLRDHLYNSANSPLSWKQRLEICIGAARGLQYLHSGASHMIIHRDVKTTNILLDDKWVAKFSDFGLSKLGPTSVSQTHVTTVVKGSFGYLDPEYYRRQQLTAKSDVYSFGVVLWEVLCARPPLLRSAEKERVSLAEWARECYRNEMLDKIVDPFLKGKITPECLNKFGEVAVNCLLDEGIKRPTMDDVVGGLEFALQLQESAKDPSLGGVTKGTLFQKFTTGDSNGIFTASCELGVSVFSELMDAKGR